MHAALGEDNQIDKQVCWKYLQGIAARFEALETADVCGKCSTGACALESAV